MWFMRQHDPAFPLLSFSPALSLSPYRQHYIALTHSHQALFPQTRITLRPSLASLLHSTSWHPLRSEPAVLPLRCVLHTFHLFYMCRLYLHYKKSLIQEELPKLAGICLRLLQTLEHQIILNFISFFLAEVMERLELYKDIKSLYNSPCRHLHNPSDLLHHMGVAVAQLAVATGRCMNVCVNGWMWSFVKRFVHHEGVERRYITAAHLPYNHFLFFPCSPTHLHRLHFHSFLRVDLALFD